MQFQNLTLWIVSQQRVGWNMVFSPFYIIKMTKCLWIHRINSKIIIIRRYSAKSIFPFKRIINLFCCWSFPRFLYSFNTSRYSFCITLGSFCSTFHYCRSRHPTRYISHSWSSKLIVRMVYVFIVWISPEFFL